MTAPRTPLGPTSRPLPGALPQVFADPWSTDVLMDPVPLQREIRESGPVVWLSAHDIHATGRYDLVRQCLADWQTFESSSGVGLSNKKLEPPWRPPSLLLEADPPWHDSPRSTLAAILNPRQLRELRAHWSRTAARVVDDLVEAAETTDGFVDVEAVSALSTAFPMAVFPDAVGLAEDGREHLFPYSDHSFNTFGPRNELVTRGEATVEEHGSWILGQCQRDALHPGGLGAAVWDAADREEITDVQAPLLVRSLLSAGLDTTVHSISAVLYALATHPAAWAALRREPQRAAVAFDEAVRWWSPVQAFTRTTTRPVTLAGTYLPEGAKILLSFGAANRDPRRWRDPDTYDLDRDPSGHVGFGRGVHQCVGQHVARLETICLLEALSVRVHRLSVRAEPVVHLNNTLRGVGELRLRLDLTDRSA